MLLRVIERILFSLFCSPSGYSQVKVVLVVDIGLIPALGGVFVGAGAGSLLLATK